MDINSIKRANEEDENMLIQSKNNTQYKIHLRGARCFRKVLITGWQLTKIIL